MSSHDFLTKRIDRHIGKWLLSVVNVAWCAISHATPLPFLSFASALRQWAHNSRQKQHLTNCVLNKQDQTLHSSSWPISLWSVFLNWSIRFPASSLVKRKQENSDTQIKLFFRLVLRYLILSPTGWLKPTVYLIRNHNHQTHTVTQNNATKTNTVFKNQI